MVSLSVLARVRALLASVPIGDGAPVVVMGALNVSPESFYAGSVPPTLDALVATALTMVEAGASIIDVGARSTAPYRSADVTSDEERGRLGRAVEALAAKLPVPVSADTSRATVAEAALEAGARVVNDVSGFADPAMGRVVQSHGAGVILMAHPDVAPSPRPDPVPAVRAGLSAALERARQAKIADEQVVLDPGIGFFRDEALPWHEWDVRVLAGLEELHDLGRPLAVGVSRKSFIGALTGRGDPADRLAGSLAATAIAVINGAALIRTHDVGETKDAVLVAERVARARRP
jgi:dihydropteroate synthase